MPYDGTDFEPWPKPPKRPSAKARVLSLAVFVFALLLLILPVSAGAFIDIVHYLWHR